MEWYYALKGEQQGPVSDSQLRQLLATGTIDKNTLVWNQDMPDWQRWGDIAEADADTPSLSPLGRQPSEPEPTTTAQPRPTAAVPGGPACVNHSSVAAKARCAGCAETYCAACLVEIGGNEYCGSCKMSAVKGRRLPTPAKAMTCCATAREAMKYALIGIFCFGIILEPIAIYKGFQARKEVATDPTLLGSGLASAAIILGFVFLLLNIAGCFAQVGSL